MQELLHFRLSSYQPAWSGGLGRLPFKGQGGYRGRTWGVFAPGPPAIPAPILSTSPLETLQWGVGQGLGKGEVGERRKIIWVWGEGEWD